MKSYIVRVTAAVEGDPTTTAQPITWTFTTEASPARREVEFAIDLKREPIQWHGAFFSGTCNVVFCTQAAVEGPTYELMAEARKSIRGPGARTTLLADGNGVSARLIPPGQSAQHRPRARNAADRRDRCSATAIVVLHVEDVFGNEQYGIAGNRPVADDYHPGDEVLIADGVHDARTKVVAADSAAGTVTVGPVADSAGRLEDRLRGTASHEREDPDAPGLFPRGGCYLRKFSPHGTPAITGAGSTRSGTWPTASTAAA